MRSMLFCRSPFALAAVPVLAAAAVALSERPGRACGGCFSRPKETTVVTDHRMAFSISPQHSVLWDQIKYSGNPSDFSWVLPVRSGTVVQASHDEWFAALDAMTTPVINGPASNCGGGGGFGCGSSSKNAPASAGGDILGVQVLSQSVVGPYDTVTLKATDPNALETWLSSNGYALPDSIRPTIAAYVAGGFDFIALRLQPGQGVQAMQPVRVVTPGADVLLPLRMVAAGVGAQVGITLYVISEGRYEAASPFFNETVSDSQLRWSATANRSNYQDLSQRLMQGHNGHTWLTESSGPTSLMPTAFTGGRQPCGVTRGAFYGQSLGDLYLSQCPCPVDAGACSTSPVDSLPPIDISPDAAGEASADASDDAAVDAADAVAFFDGAADSSSDAPSGQAWDGAADASCPQAPCAGFDDLDVALVGLHAQDVWVTRLRAILSVTALSEGDLQVQASISQTPVSSVHNANAYDDPSYSPCGTKGGCSASADGGDALGNLGNWLVLGTLGFAGAALVRRRGL